MSEKKNAGIARLNRIQAVPVDKETFKFAISIFQAAASGSYPDAHIKPPDPDSPPGVRLTNIPENRGMLAVMDETRHLTSDERQAIAMRVISFGDAVQFAELDPRFDVHVKPRSDGYTSVSDAFLCGIAVCKFKVSDDEVCADMDDLWERIKDQPTE